MTNDIPTASDVVEDILTNGFENHDIFAWKRFDISGADDLVADLIATIAAWKYDKELSVEQNRSERLTLIEDCILGHLIAAAKREGYQ